MEQKHPVVFKYSRCFSQQKYALFISPMCTWGLVIWQCKWRRLVAKFISGKRQEHRIHILVTKSAVFQGFATKGPCFFTRPLLDSQGPWFTARWPAPNQAVPTARTPLTKLPICENNLLRTGCLPALLALMIYSQGPCFSCSGAAAELQHFILVWS